MGTVMACPFFEWTTSWYDPGRGTGIVYRLSENQPDGKYMETLCCWCTKDSTRMNMDGGFAVQIVDFKTLLAICCRSNIWR